MKLDRKERCLALTVADLNANFTGLPEDPGRRPCILLFSGVATLSMALDFVEGVVISEAEVHADDNRFRIEVALTSGAQAIVATFDRLDVLDE